MFLGVTLAAIEVVPLGFYLSKSPVWQDRARERRPPWVLSRPRWLDVCCTALPYVFGSQRRGQPHLGRALGVHNLNESAGGFAGLATLVWLAPWGWWSARRRDPRVGYLAGLVAIGAMGAFGVPPVDNLLRALPVLNVMDNRRLTLWVTFGLVLLGGLGLDALSRPDRPRARRWGIGLAVAAAVVLLVGAIGVRRAESWLRPRALKHYAEAASATPGADPSAYRQRAERQVRQTLDFVPTYLGLASAQFLTLAALAWIWGRGPRNAAAARLRPALMGLTLLDLFAFGFGLNPAIAPKDDRPETPVIAHLRQTVGTSGRIVGLGEELPPNTLMRYGLADVRNYDSVELTRSLAWLAPLYEPGSMARTSRREVTWAGVVRAEDRLREAGVRAVVAASPPPDNIFKDVIQIGQVWVARLDGAPLVEARHPQTSLSGHREPGEIRLIMHNQAPETVIMRETFDPGSRAEIDGHDAAVDSYRNAFLAVGVPPGSHQLLVRYDPPEVRVAVLISMAALLAIGVFALTDFRPYRLLGIVGPRAWKDSSHRGTIGAVIFTGHSKRLTTEG